MAPTTWWPKWDSMNSGNSPIRKGRILDRQFVFMRLVYDVKMKILLEEVAEFFEKTFLILR